MLEIDEEQNALTYAQELSISLKTQDMPYAFMSRSSNDWLKSCQRFLDLNDFEIDMLGDRLDQGFIDQEEYQEGLSELLKKRRKYQAWHISAIRCLNREEKHCGFS